MVLSIKNDETDRLVRELATVTGESVTEAVTVAVRERLDRVRRTPDMVSRLERLAAEIESLPVRDRRRPEEIVGYDDHGLPT